MVSAGIGVEGGERLRAVFRALQARVRDLRPAMEDIGGSLVRSIRHRFDVGRGPRGGARAPGRRAREEGGQTLASSGRLRDDITCGAGREAVDAGTDVKYAAIHRFGGTIVPKSAKAPRFKIGKRRITARRVTVPARPFVGIDPADRAEIIAVLRDHIARFDTEA